MMDETLLYIISSNISNLKKIFPQIIYTKESRFNSDYKNKFNEINPNIIEENKTVIKKNSLLAEILDSPINSIESIINLFENGYQLQNVSYLFKIISNNIHILSLIDIRNVSHLTLHYNSDIETPIHDEYLETNFGSWIPYIKFIFDVLYYLSAKRYNNLEKYVNQIIVKEDTHFIILDKIMSVDKIEEKNEKLYDLIINFAQLNK